MAKTDPPEIIDLTKSSPPPETLAMEMVSRKGTEREKETGGSRRKRRKKRVPIEDGEVAESSTQTSNNHSREMDADRNKNPSSRRRSRSPEPRRSPSPRPRDKFADLFYVDVQPVQVPVSVRPTIPEENRHDTAMNGEMDNTKLRLPEHVSVFGVGECGTGPVEIFGPPMPNPDDEDDDFIEYLDYDDRNKGLVRYFNEIDEDTKPTRFVCKNCGAEGEHKTVDCPVQICLTCGARNEHSTRSCPISKTCYTCGMKGHINQNCPNRYDRRGIDNCDDCDRCGGITHKTNECPTWWRMYEYVSDEERLLILQAREAKQHLGIGQGGEGYVGIDAWCYNCGGAGHWGDNCNKVPHLWDFPREPSAFSVHNTMSGPFFDPAAEPAQYQASYYDRQDDSLLEGWGMDAPSNVGKQGRKKDRAKLQKKFREQEAVSDSDDWFLNPANARSRGMQPPSNRAGLHAAKIMIFGASMKEAGRQFQPLPAPERPKLIDRIHDGDERSTHRSQHGDRRGPPREDQSRRKRDDLTHQRSRDEDCVSRDLGEKGRNGRNRERDRNNGYRDRRREGDRTYRRDSGPRYTGGYSR